MARRDPLASEPVGRLDEGGELHLLVAQDARIRRPARAVAVDKIAHDRFARTPLSTSMTWWSIPSFAQSRSRAPEERVAAAGARRRGGPGVAVEAKGHAEHAVSLLVEHPCGGGAVDAAAHSHDDVFRFHLSGESSRSRATTWGNASRNASTSSPVLTTPRLMRIPPCATPGS